MAEIRHLDNREIALSQRKIIHDSHVTKYESFKNSRWRSAAVLKIIFGHTSAADCPILVKCCMAKQFFTEFL